MSKRCTSSTSNNSKTFNAIPDIDGLKIIYRLPGWKDEYDALFKFLIGSNQDPENYYLYRKTFKCCSFCYRSILARKDAKDLITSFVYEYAGDIAAKYGMDDNGKPEIVNDEYNPQKCKNKRVPPFINYLTNTNIIFKRLNSFMKRHKMKREEQASALSIKTDGGKIIEFFDTVPDLYCEEHTPEESMVNKIESVTPFLLKFLDDKLKTLQPSDNTLPKITNNYLMSVFQLYPQISGCEAYVQDESRYKKDEFGWYRCHESFEYNDKGLGRAINETFKKLKNNNPNDPPEKTILDCHKSSRRYIKISSQNDDVDANDDDFIWRVMKRCFAPINKSKYLICLFGNNYQTQFKNSYLIWIEEHWFRRNAAKIHELIDP